MHIIFKLSNTDRHAHAVSEEDKAVQSAPGSPRCTHIHHSVGDLTGPSAPQATDSHIHTHLHFQTLTNKNKSELGWRWTTKLCSRKSDLVFKDREKNYFTFTIIALIHLLFVKLGTVKCIVCYFNSEHTLEFVIVCCHSSLQDQLKYSRIYKPRRSLSP